MIFYTLTPIISDSYSQLKWIGHATIQLRIPYFDPLSLFDYT